MKRPLAVIVIIFCLGIVVSGFLTVDFRIIFLIAVIFSAACILLFNKEGWAGFSVGLIIFLCGIVISKNDHFQAGCRIDKFLFPNPIQCMVKGIIDDDPQKNGDSYEFVFKTEAIQVNGENKHCCGNIFVRVKSTSNFHCGDELILCGKLRRCFSRYLSRQKICAVMSVDAARGIVRLNINKGNKLKIISYWLKDKSAKIIHRYLQGVPAEVMEAMVLGEKKGIPQPVNLAMMKSGTIHILVVSGFNVGLVSFIILALSKIMRIPKTIRLYLSCFLLIIYCFLTGACVPVLRATVMALMFLFSYSAKRKPDIYNSLCLAGLIILINHPQQLFDIGFQLSFASVASIACFYPRVKIIFRRDILEYKFVEPLIDGILVSFSAWLGTAGFIAYYFRIISPVTVIANLFIVPLATLITFCGFSLLLSGLICPPLAHLFASSTTFLVSILLNLNNFLIKLPFASFSLYSTS